MALKLFFCFLQDRHAFQRRLTLRVPGPPGKCSSAGLFPRARATLCSRLGPSLCPSPLRERPLCECPRARARAVPRLGSRPSGSRGSARVAQSPGAGRSLGSRSPFGASVVRSVFCRFWGWIPVRRAAGNERVRGGRYGGRARAAGGVRALAWVSAAGLRWAPVGSSGGGRPFLRRGQCSERLDVSVQTGSYRWCLPRACPAARDLRDTRPVVGAPWECTRGDPIVRLHPGSTLLASAFISRIFNEASLLTKNPNNFDGC